MKRFAAILVLFSLTAPACRDDQVVLERGPLGPAAYEVTVRASDDRTNREIKRRASLRIDPRPGGAAFSLRTEEGEVIEAELRRLQDGSVNLQGVTGLRVDRSGEAELASLVGQLTPPLPREPVRLGERWSSSPRIQTSTLRATFRSELGIARFRRIASTDTAELVGNVSGRLRTSASSGILEGTLRGRTRIAWSVTAGRVVAAETKLVWTLSAGDHVTLETIVRPQ